MPTNAWTGVSVVGTTNVWMYQRGVGVDAVYDRTFADYQSGPFAGAVDNVNFTVFAPIPTLGPPFATVDFNFELQQAPRTTATPEPASLALMGTGLLVLGGVGYRRRKARA